MAQVMKLTQFIIVLPATNASSERVFSALRRLKTYLRSSMSRRRLNNIMVLHVHSALTDQLDFISVANNFVQGSEHRTRLFGTFIHTDLTTNVCISPTF